MSRFKIGDELKVVNATGFGSFDNGKVAKLTSDQGLWEGEQSWWGQGWTCRHKESELELVSPRPIVTEVVTVTRIQPGVYGELEVLHTDLPIYARLKLNREVLTSAEIRKIIEQMSAIADHLESQKP